MNLCRKQLSYLKCIQARGRLSPPASGGDPLPPPGLGHTPGRALQSAHLVHITLIKPRAAAQPTPVTRLDLLLARSFPLNLFGRFSWTCLPDCPTTRPDFHIQPHSPAWFVPTCLIPCLPVDSRLTCSSSSLCLLIPSFCPRRRPRASSPS